MDKETKVLAQKVSALEKAVHKLQDTPRKQDQTRVEPQQASADKGVNAPGAALTVSPAPAKSKRRRSGQPDGVQKQNPAPRREVRPGWPGRSAGRPLYGTDTDRKSTRLNSSH